MKPNSEVLYISYDGLTDPLGQSQILPYLTGLASAGYDFTIISCEKPERFHQRKAEIEKICSQYNILWKPIKYTKNPPVISTVFDIIRMRRMAFKLAAQHDFKIVHCRSYISALIGLALQKRKKLKFVFDMRGLWADERVDGGLWNLRNPLYRFIYCYFKKKERTFLNAADYVVSLTQNAADEIHSWKHIKNQPIPIAVIPCSADMDLFDANKISEADKWELKLKLGISKEDFVLSYIGSIGTWYMLDEMLDFFAELLIKKPKSKFLFITNDPVSAIQEKARARGIPHSSIIVTQAARNQMPLHISISDYTIFFIKPSYSKKASSPVKQGETMSMGIPIICNSGVGDTDLIVKESNAGFVINDFSKDAYNKVIDALGSKMDNNSIRAGALKWYSLTSAIQKYKSVYSTILR